MKIITLNANGIRSAAKKGFFTWLEQQNADIVCVQETKAQEKVLGDTYFPAPQVIIAIILTPLNPVIVG